MSKDTLKSPPTAWLLRAAPKRGFFLFALFHFLTRKRVNEFLHVDLFFNDILLQLIHDVSFNGFLVSSQSVDVISSAPDFSIAVFLFQIGMPVENHQRTLPFQFPMDA